MEVKSVSQVVVQFQVMTVQLEVDPHVSLEALKLGRKHKGTFIFGGHLSKRILRCSTAVSGYFRLGTAG